MYPLKAVLIQCDDECLGSLQRDLAKNGVLISGTYNDVKTALKDLYQQKNKDRLLLIVQVVTNPDHKAIEELNNCFEGWPILALLPSEATADFLLKASKAGASQFISLPLQPDELKASLHRIALQFGFKLNKSTIVAFASVSEGAGATSLSINVADVLASHYNAKVILMELAHQCGRLAVYLNLKPRFSINHLFQDIERMDTNLIKKALIQVNNNLSVLTGPQTPLLKVNYHANDLVRLLALTKDLADVVIVDIPNIFDEIDLKTIINVDVIFLVGQPILPSIQAMILARDLLHQEHYTGRIVHVFNQYSTATGGFDSSRLRSSLKIDELHTIADDPRAFNKAANLGRTLREVSPSSRAYKDIQNLALLVNHNQAYSKNSKHFLRSLLRKICKILWYSEH